MYHRNVSTTPHLLDISSRGFIYAPLQAQGSVGGIIYTRQDQTRDSITSNNHSGPGDTNWSVQSDKTLHWHQTQTQGSITASWIWLSCTAVLQTICATDTSNHLSTINRASAVKQTITNRCILETDFKSKGAVLQRSVINKRSEQISWGFWTSISNRVQRWKVRGWHLPSTSPSQGNKHTLWIESLLLNTHSKRILWCCFLFLIRLTQAKGTQQAATITCTCREVQQATIKMT